MSALPPPATSRPTSYELEVLGWRVIHGDGMTLAEREAAGKIILEAAADARGETPRSETEPKPQCSYEPLSIMAIEGNQNWLRTTLPAKFHDFYDKLVKMAINCVLYGEEIQRLRDTPRSATPRNPWTFELSAAQVAKMETWRKVQDAMVLERQRKEESGEPFIDAVHASGSPYYGAVGGELTFLFSPNSIGEVAQVRHSGTGAELDLTDYDAW